MFHFTPQYAVGTSLAVVFANAVSGTLAYVRQKKVYYDAAIRFALATLPGAVLGSYTAHYFTNRVFFISFGLLLMSIAGLLHWRTRHELGSAKGHGDFPVNYDRGLGISISVVVGFLSSTFGIGGGIIHVPAMIGLLGFTPHVATATSHFVLAISACIGVVSHFLLGNILLMPALIVGSGAAIGAQLGAHLSPKTKPRSISRLLCVALFVLGLKMILS